MAWHCSVTSFRLSKLLSWVPGPIFWSRDITSVYCFNTVNYLRRKHERIRITYQVFQVITLILLFPSRKYWLGVGLWTSDPSLLSGVGVVSYPVGISSLNKLFLLKSPYRKSEIIFTLMLDLLISDENLPFARIYKFAILFVFLFSLLVSL